MLRSLMFIALVAVTMLPGRAWPCSYRCRVPTVEAPADGATDVPLNARIWVADESLRYEPVQVSEFYLRKVSDGTDVFLELATLSAGARSVSVLTPQTKLEPDTTYELRTYDKAYRNFTTGTTEDTTPPAPPRVLSEELVSDQDFDFPWSDSCGSSSTYGARYMLASEGLVQVIDVGRTAQVSPEFGSTEFPGIATPDATGGDTYVFVGNSVCGTVGASPGDETDVRFGTYDIAGNFSGFTEPVPVKIPSGCGCASGSEAGSVLLLGLAMLGLRRTNEK